MTQGVQRKGARVALTELPRGLVPKACLHICLTLHTPLHASLTGSLKARPLLVPVLHVQGAVLGSGLRRHPAPRFYSFLFASSSNAAFSSQVYTEADEDGHLSMAQEVTRHWDWQGLAHSIGWVRTRTLVETWGGS